MFTPEKMHQINVVVFETEVDAVARTVLRLGLLHLVQLDDSGEWAGELDQVRMDKLGSRIEGVRARVSGLMKNLGIRELPREKKEYSPPEVTPDLISEVERDISTLEDRLETIRQREDQLYNRREKLEGMLTEFAPLSDLRVPVSESPYTFLLMRYGEVERENLDYIRDKISSLSAVLLTLSSEGEREVVLLVGLKSDRLKLKRILREAAFREMEIPEKAKETAPATDELKDKIEQIDGQLSEVSKEINELKEKNTTRLLEWHRALTAAHLLMKVKGYLKKTRKTYVLSGWIPSNKRKLVEKEILREARGRAIIEVIPPAEITGYRRGKLKVPVLLKHPRFFRPFQMLVSSFGTPGYRLIDPTPVVAISFMVMFGMMFGDIGHGVVLAVLGYLLGFRGTSGNEGKVLAGRLAFYCGLSSILFGFMFGSIFGVEDLIPHIWMKPMNNVLYFFKVALYFGIAMITLGIIFNLVNAVRTRNIREALFGQSGLVSAVIYWVGVGVVSVFLANRSIPVILLVFALGIPVLLLFLREPIMALIQHRHVSFSGGVLTYLMETVIEVMEIVTGYLGNTVSFIRVAAFSLAHVGLFIAVFSMADMVRGKSGGIVYWSLIMLVGNIVIIGLEGLVVTIQAIRLEYYEFFGKFFVGGGESYKPIGLGGSPDHQE